MASWRVVPLDSVTTCIIDHRGRTPKKLDGDFAETGVPVVSARNVKGGRLNTREGVRFVTPEMYRRWMPVQLEAGDVLLTSEAPLGEVAFLTDSADLVLGQRLFALRANPDVIDPRYLYYSLRSPLIQKRLVARATGTTAQGIRQSELRRVEINLPPMDVQRHIVGRLFGIEGLIESDRRLASQMDEMVRTRFWLQFGDLLTSSGGARLTDWVTITNGVSYRSGDLTDGSPAALVTLRSVRRGGGYDPDGLKPYSGEFRPTQLVLPGEVVVARTDLTQAGDVVGRPAVVRPSRAHETLIASLDLAVVRPRLEWVTAPFLYGLLGTPGWVTHSRGHANGTTVLHLRSSAFEAHVACPAIEDVATFSAVAGLWLRLASSAAIESEVLVSLRDVLLRRLLGRSPASDEAA